MRITKLNQIFGILAVTATFCGAEAALAQNAPPPHSMKTIGAPSAPAKPEIVPSLFVLNSRGATLQGDTLTLTGVTPSSIIFADRPVRSAGHQPTADVIAEWGSGDDSFAKNPPNATLSVFGKDGLVKDAVVVLKNPKLEGDRLTFNVQILEGDIAGAGITLIRPVTETRTEEAGLPPLSIGSLGKGHILRFPGSNVLRA